MLQEIEQNTSKIIQNLKESHNMQNNYVDSDRVQREFQVAKKLFLKVKGKKSSLRLGSCKKLVARFYGTFEVLNRIGHVAYEHSLPDMIEIHNVFHVPFLKKCV